MVHPKLAAHRAAWASKPALRLIYRDFHRRLLDACPEGPVLEIGGGSGHLKESAGDRALCSIDILPSPWTDAVADAGRLPFAERAFAGIVLLDVLHHLPEPARFFGEAARLLRPGGRLALIEPGITPLSGPVYRLLHEEPVDMAADPLADASADPLSSADPFDSNQAIPTLLFTRPDRIRAFHARFPELRLVRAEWLSLFAYPLSGGFKPWSLIPAALAAPLLRVEDRLLPTLGRTLAFRLFVVLERTAP